MKKTNANHELVGDFNKKLHIVGRIWTFCAILLFASIPIVLGLYFKTTPNWSVFGTVAVLVPFVINFFSGVLEPIIYAPMLGTNGEYLAFITGNLSNLKIPCVVKAQEIVGTKMGTEENELVSTIAIATSTLTTVLIVAIFVLFLAVSSLQEAIENNPFILPAFSCVIYALFGSLGGKYIAKNPKLAFFPAVVISVLSAVLALANINAGSAYLMVGIAICLLFAFFQYMHEKKRLKILAEKRHIEAIAAGLSDEANIKIERSWEQETKEAKLKKAPATKLSENKIEEIEVAIEDEIADDIEGNANQKNK